MRILTRMLRQKCIYWELEGDVNQFGERKFLLPVEIKCRWEDVGEELLQDDAKEQVFDATIFVDRDVKEGGLLMLGTLADLTSSDPPKSILSKRIRKFEKIPTMKGNRFLRVAYL